jgi:hypothetical protein
LYGYALNFCLSNLPKFNSFRLIWISFVYCLLKIMNYEFVFFWRKWVSDFGVYTDNDNKITKIFNFIWISLKKFKVVQSSSPVESRLSCLLCRVFEPSVGKDGGRSLGVVLMLKIYPSNALSQIMRFFLIHFWMFIFKCYNLKNATMEELENVWTSQVKLKKMPF